MVNNNLKLQRISEKEKALHLEGFFYILLNGYTTYLTPLFISV